MALLRPVGGRRKEKCGMGVTPAKIKSNYNAENIQILEGLEAVRRRPGMYIGSTSERGFHHLAYEILDNCVDEAMAGYCHEVELTIHPDNSVTVRDDGRGVPVDIHKQTGQSALEVVLTKLHAGGKFGGGGYKGAGGLHGVGASVVNALSVRFEAEVTREGDTAVWGIGFSRGKVTEPFGQRGTCDAAAHGTTVTFLPDPDIFSVHEYDRSVLADRMREVAYLTRGLRLVLVDERPGASSATETFYAEDGLSGFVKYLAGKAEPLFEDVITVAGEKDDVKVEIAFRYGTDYAERVDGYVNNIHTPDGGTHLAGFWSALTRVVNKFAQENGSLKKKAAALSVDDLREGLTAVVSCRVLEPEFEGQTKQKLGNAEVRGIVGSVMKEQLTTYFELHPDICKAVCAKAVATQNARNAARQARENARRKTAMDSGAMPGKLADCSDKNPANCELCIVEGKSAGGTAKLARDRRYQAVLGLRGKPLNVDKASESHILGNAEIQSLSTAIGTGVQENFDLSKLRYDKIVIMADADVDGAHIRTLLLTFFWRYMRGLVKAGHVYLANPPLYKVSRGKKSWYAYSDRQLDDIVSGLGPGKNQIQRYKGLGEMDPEQLWETTLDPERRLMYQVSYDDLREAEISGLFDVLMGEMVGPRRAYIEEHAHEAEIDA